MVKLIPIALMKKKDQYEIRVTVKSTIKRHDTFKCGCKLYKCAKPEMLQIGHGKYLKII